MKFLTDNCVGQRLTDWLRLTHHDVLNARELGVDPGDRAILELAHAEDRVLITMDKDFGELIYRDDRPHAGLVRLPDVPMEYRIALMERVIGHHRPALEARAVITVRGTLQSGFRIHQRAAPLGDPSDAGTRRP